MEGGLVAREEVDALLANAPREVGALALETRALLLEEFPDAIEQVKAGWNGIWYGPGSTMGEQVFEIQPFRHHVNLNFTIGAHLPDPSGLLEGTGKNMRHVKVADEKILRTPELRALIRVAIARGGTGKRGRPDRKKPA
jgi:hypothetical protein